MGSSEGKFDVKILGEETAWITAGADSTVLNNTYECSLSAVDQDTHPTEGFCKWVTKRWLPTMS